MDTDNSKVFSDIKMTPNELTDVIRRRRDVKLNDESNRRRKRALSPYDFYDTDSVLKKKGPLIIKFLLFIIIYPGTNSFIFHQLLKQKN